MAKSKTKKEAYNDCSTRGMNIPLRIVDVDKVEALVRIADEDLLSARDLVKNNHWNSSYKIHYDVLHELVEAFLLFDKVKTLNHQCLFAYICVKYPQLELDWNFFEQLRTKRNGINYYGTPVLKSDWKKIELQFNLYVNLLKREINIKIKMHK